MNTTTAHTPRIVPDYEAMLDPAPGYRELAAEGAVQLVRRVNGGLAHYAVLDYKLAQEALRSPVFSKTSEAMHFALRLQDADPANYPISGGAGAPNLLNTDGADHMRLRNLVNMTFSPRRVQQLRGRVEALVDRLIADLQEQTDWDLVGQFAYPVGLTMICDILGVPQGDRDNFRHWATQSMRITAPDQKENAGRLKGYLVDLVQAKRAQVDMALPMDEQPDVLSALCVARDGGESLDADELISMSFLMLIAGHETTVGLIGSALILLDRFRDQRAMLLADPDLMRGAIEEVLRYDGPVHQTTMRATNADVELGGVRIPRGSFVHVYTMACNRDPERWPDPDRFDITRKPIGSLAFGYGPHMCLGLHLARLEAEVALTKFLHAFPDYRLAGTGRDIEWAGTVIRAAAIIRAVPR